MNLENLETRLDNLLTDQLQSVLEREDAMVKGLALEHGGPFVLFGAGALGRFALGGLRAMGVEPSLFADNNSSLWGKEVDGLTIKSVTEAAAEFGPGVPIIVTVYTGAKIREQLREMGLRVFSFPTLALRFPDALMPHNCIDYPHKMAGHEAQIREGLSVWADESSRREYVAQVQYRLTFGEGVPPCLPPRETYFPEDLVTLTDDEVFVDCGAYDGDSIRDFLGRCRNQFRGIVALEPDPKNAAALETSISGLPEDLRRKVEIVVSAAASYRGTLTFDATGNVGATVGGEGQTQVTCVPLDAVLSSQPPTYIKMDIEGSEPDALAGARRVIAEHAPVLAVCLYHRQEDLWQIPLQIRAMNDRYRLFLRRYSDDCWEQVCYAIPKERVRV